MKIFLSNAPWYEEGEHGFLGVRAGSRWPHKWAYNPNMKINYRPFPFFMATASTLLKEHGFDVEFRDSIESGDTFDYFYEILQQSGADFILMETSTPSLKNDLMIAEQIKELLPNIRIIFSGLHIEVAEESFLAKYPFIDFTIYGEYELPLLRLMEAARENTGLASVPALIYRDNGEIRKNERGKAVSMSELPWPDRDSISTDYYDGMNGLGKPQLQMHTSRGCPYHCNFCVWPQLVYGNHLYRMREPQDIVDEILANLKKVDYKSIYFDDDAVNINKQHILELCRLMKENGLDKIRWGCMARADLMDDEILDALKDAGCYSLKYGVETFNQEILDRTGKAMNVEKNVANIKKTREEYGLKVHLTYCLGLLGDTEETVQDTIKKALELEADSRQFSIATPYPGSKLWDIYRKNGWIATEDYDLFDGHNTSVVRQDGISPERLSVLRQYAECEDRKQRAVRLPLEFMMKDKRQAILAAVGGSRRILITCTTRRGIVAELYKMFKAEGNEVYVMTGAEWLSAFETISKEDLIVLPAGTRIDKRILTKEIKRCRDELMINIVVIPTRGSGECGYDNVIETAEAITDNIIRISELADLKVLGKEEKNAV